MTRRGYTFHLLICCPLLLAFTITTQAQSPPNRTWVATTGSNSNPCTRTLPCRDFSFAIAAVADGGEVVVLDSGGYGAVEITKSVQLIAPVGVHAAIAPATGIPVPGLGVTAAVVVNAPSAIVVLRNLYINKQGALQRAITAVDVGTLHVESCVLNGFIGGTGIEFRAGGQLRVRDTVVRHNSTGIFVTAPAGGMALASIDRCRIESNSANAIYGSDRSQVTVSNTVVVGSRAFDYGFLVSANAGQTAELNCESCVASNLDVGFRNFGSAGAVMRVSRSAATNNNTGFANIGGLFESLQGTNMVSGNTTNTSGTITPITSP